MREGGGRKQRREGGTEAQNEGGRREGRREAQNEGGRERGRNEGEMDGRNHDMTEALTGHEFKEELYG